MIKGTDEQNSLAERVFAQLRHLLRQQQTLSPEDVRAVLEVVTQGGVRIGTSEEKPEIGSRYLRAAHRRPGSLCQGASRT